MCKHWPPTTSPRPAPVSVTASVRQASLRVDTWHNQHGQDIYTCHHAPLEALWEPQSCPSCHGSLWCCCPAGLPTMVPVLPASKQGFCSDLQNPDPTDPWESASVRHLRQHLRQPSAVPPMTLPLVEPSQGSLKQVKWAVALGYWIDFSIEMKL